MSAYRYWRLTFTAIQDTISAVVAGLELHTSVGGADVTGSGTASASSVYSIHTANAAFDHNAATYWCSIGDPKPHWLQYDLGAAQEIVEYALTNYSGAGYASLAWMVSASPDGANWTVVDNKSATTWGNGETKTFAIDTPLVAAEFPSSQEPVIDASHYWIHSTVDRLGVPGRYPVRLYNRASGALLRESKSAAADGAYQFQFLPYLERGYQVIALDDPATRSDPKNAAIADLMTPEAMP